MTLSDAVEGIEDHSGITICGPSKLQSFIDTTKYFMKVPIDKMRFSHSFQCNDVNIKSIIFNNLDDYTNHRQHIYEHICYIGITPSLPGKFDINKAQILKIPKGPLYGRLKNGYSITLDDGTIISSSQVVGDSEPGKIFWIICCIDCHVAPTIEYISENPWSGFSFSGRDDIYSSGICNKCR